MSRAVISIASKADRERAANWAIKAPTGTRIEFKERKRSMTRDERRGGVVLPVAHCKECSKEFAAEWITRVDINGRFMPGLRGKSVYCSDTCSEQARRKRLGMLAKRREVAKRGVYAEMIDPFVVGERDKWTCQLCGIRTPLRLRSTRHPSAPEVDHILPLSRGGEHTYANVQIACKRCNMAKGATPLGQSRMAV